MKKKNLDYGVMCDVGGKRKGNQDSLMFSEFDLIIAPGSLDSKQYSYKTILGIVCDGVSASNKGERASTFVIRHLSAKIIEYLYLKNVEINQLLPVIRDFIFKTNNELITQFKDLKDVPQTTLAGFLVIGQWLWIFNIGDSRIFVFKDNQTNQISVDHIGTGAAHEITQALGRPEIKPELKIFNWAYESDSNNRNLSFNSNYYILVCSDGLTDQVNQDEIHKILNDESSTKNVQEKVETLYNLTMKRKIDDNVSIIVVDLAKYLNSLSPIQIIKLSYTK